MRGLAIRLQLWVPAISLSRREIDLRLISTARLASAEWDAANSGRMTTQPLSFKFGFKSRDDDPTLTRLKLITA